ncbi:hypothetical protein D3C76_1109430 [compost metagenome]
MDDRRGRPGEQGGHHQTDTLARTSWCKRQHMLGAFMAQVLLLEHTEEHASWPRQPSLAYLIRIGPARRAIGGDLPRLAGAPDGHADGHPQGQQAAARSDATANIEDVRRVGIEEEPPLEQSPRVIDRRAQPFEPGRSQASLVAKCGSGPLRGPPHPGKGNGQHRQNLAVQHCRRLHP